MRSPKTLNFSNHELVPYLSYPRSMCEVQGEITMPLLELTTLMNDMLNTLLPNNFYPISCTFNVRLFWPAWTLFRLQLLHRRQHLLSPTFDYPNNMILPISRHHAYIPNLMDPSPHNSCPCPARVGRPIPKPPQRCSYYLPKSSTSDLG